MRPRTLLSASVVLFGLGLSFASNVLAIAGVVPLAVGTILSLVTALGTGIAAYWLGVEVARPD